MALYINGNKTGGGGGGNSNMRELTQAEYDALTTEEKNNGTVYYITDGDDSNGGYQLIQPIIYSEEEREVGVWTDGKPLYQKTFIFIPTDNNFYIDVASLNIDKVVENRGSIYQEGGNIVPIPYYTANSDFAIAYYNNTNSSTNRLGIVQNSNGYNLNVTWVVTWKYTKTTDVAGSGKWTPQGIQAVHYSTEEQVVGTWVDGSILYEKTVEFGALPNTATKTVPHGITNVDMIFATEAFMFNPTTGYSTYLNMTNDTISSQAQYVVNRNNIEIWAGLNRTEWMGYVTVRYTKTTT